MPTATIEPVVDAEARNAIVEANAGLVHKEAWTFRGRGVALEDLVQSGQVGLIRAAEKFEPGRGLRFSTYAVCWIRQAMFQALEAGRPIHVWPPSRRDAADVRRCAEAMEAETGTTPMLSE